MIPPNCCQCGHRIEPEISTNPNDKDFLPGRKYWTCKNFKNDGLHFRQPWVIGIEDEVRRLRKQMDEMLKEVAELKKLIPRV